MTAGETERAWHRIDPGDLAVGGVTTVVAAQRALAITRTAAGYAALDNRCPHQGGPLGEGHIEDGCLICPWHGYEYDPVTGAPPPGYDDAATAFPLEERDDGLYVELPVPHRTVTLMDQMVDVMTEWGVDTVFGMVGHSNLGLADAFRIAEKDGRLTYFGIRHEGAGAFAASAYAKLTGRPAACFSIAGPGATNLLTGLWDAKVDRVPILALTGQVQSQVLGPGAFQEIPTASAFEAVAEWSQTVVTSANASELMALAVKHAVVNRDVAHLIFPDDVQNLRGLEEPPPRPIEGRLSAIQIAPPTEELERACEMLVAAKRPVIIAGNGARPYRRDVIALAEHIDAPVITTFKAKGLIGDDHPLGCGVLGRSGTPVGSAVMGRSDLLLVLGASFSNHTGISTKKPTIQVDFDRMMLGKFHPVTVALWGEIGRTLALMQEHLPATSRPELREDLAARWAAWRAEKTRRREYEDAKGRMHPALLFDALGSLVAPDAVIPVDVGNNTYAFGHYFECRGDQDIIMSGYLGSIGFALPAALGAWAATRGSRQIVSISGDGGLGQYLAEFTTAVKYGMEITHVVLNNDELAKISREQVGALRPVWQTSLVNPDFGKFAELCGGRGFTVTDATDLGDALREALAVTGGPSLVEVRSSGRWV
ncbi:MAG TPA: thiamine pyrophosphate-binding protein [Acidimicrobiia bacterium]|jgi:thiamine pyrophosphate-dependent acetolactate synthase large subunit-like protein/nitrite reductase/ring-hydroxylating ferredoxin subunit